jgi:integrase
MMSSTPSTGADRQLPRGHLLVLNRSFRRTADQLARWKPATAHNRYRGLHAFFKWAVAEGDLAASPMDGMRPPQLPEQPVEVVRAEQLVRLLKTSEAGMSPAAVTPPSSCCWSIPACAPPTASA